MALFGNTGASNDFSQMQGSATNDSAAAGNIGEKLESSVPVGSGPSLTTATATNVTSINLTSGDWEVSGQVILEYSSATQSGDGQASISSTSGSMQNNNFDTYNPLRLTTTTCKSSLTLSPQRFSVSGTATTYLVAQATFSAGTCKASGYIHARRCR